MAAIDTLRWARVNNRKKRHLWLGQATACGITDWHHLSVDAPDEACRTCLAYAQGWLDRHIYGPSPRIDQPNPICVDTRLPEGGTQ